MILANLSTPDDGACNSSGQVYVGEASIGSIVRFNSDGSGLTTILDPGLELSPEGLALDSDGNLYFNTGGLSTKGYPAKGVFASLVAIRRTLPRD